MYCKYFYYTCMSYNYKVLVTHKEDYKGIEVALRTIEK